MFIKYCLWICWKQILVDQSEESSQRPGACGDVAWMKAGKWETAQEEWARHPGQPRLPHRLPSGCPPTGKHVPPAGWVEQVRVRRFAFTGYWKQDILGYKALRWNELAIGIWGGTDFYCIRLSDTLRKTYDPWFLTDSNVCSLIVTSEKCPSPPISKLPWESDMLSCKHLTKPPFLSGKLPSISWSPKVMASRPSFRELESLASKYCHNTWKLALIFFLLLIHPLSVFCP